ncbi:Na+ dependent nucleoside transporter domain protein [Pseudodesulfovibrio profundus]|uniref:Na+ dependent nucleoside transporter domain protein n=1 Tax=Pseudodesulfovibrio profundus TaxID=57320 RepID=A0A2C8F6X2_9BACT|nr:nucleoside transporter C-terminal domain-containing protein [Pseudodesulfovibrio profundus]MBC16608.1 nucleoside:proton symporter [Desulfovibrio sp.]SOB58368.1 Na+ dependent nucleoside transporter domain protein [Pseudodesulfovibrio profundus]|tara:strand:- start:779 stop:2020 length:1242 start_codon:yes stop_codon:yes gene_type:complete
MLQSGFGLLALVLLAWLMSENRGKVRISGVAIGVGLQLILGLLMLKVPIFEQIFLGLNSVALAIEKATMAGTSFVFGYLGGGPLPFEEPYPGAGFILAFRALPIILIMSVISAVLYYWRVLPVIVSAFSYCLEKTMKIGGALGVGAASNIFVGMVEAPLMVKPYLGRMTRSELFTIMTCGMATIAGTMLVLYASILAPVIPNAMGQILAASIISAPAAILIARVMVPETAKHMTEGSIVPPREAASTMDAVTLGTSDGIKILLNVVAMLLVLVALVSLINAGLAFLPDVMGAPLTLQRMLGWIMAPVVWLIGIPWAEAQTAGTLMGTKTILNEFLAYLELAKLEPGVLSERSRVIMTYAMCGFANFGSLGIMIGGLSVMAPQRRDEIVQLGAKSIISGTLATLMTGAVVGVIL